MITIYHVSGVGEGRGWVVPTRYSYACKKCIRRILGGRSLVSGKRFHNLPVLLNVFYNIWESSLAVHAYSESPKEILNFFDGINYVI